MCWATVDLRWHDGITTFISHWSSHCLDLEVEVDVMSTWAIIYWMGNAKNVYHCLLSNSAKRRTCFRPKYGPFF
jgi:hypothetical protein